MPTEQLPQRVAISVEKLRETRSMSQAQIATHLGISQQQVSKKLLGKHEFTLTEVDKLGDLFKVPVQNPLPEDPT